MKKKMGNMKRRQQRKRQYRTNETTKNKSSHSSRVTTKNFEIFVTDFLADPCGLPVDLRDCVLVDGNTPVNETSEMCSANNSQVLKKIFGNNESIERIIKNSASLLIEETSKKTNECLTNI